MNLIKEYIEEAKKYALNEPKRAYKSASLALEQSLACNSKFDQAQAYYYMAYACRIMSDYVAGLSNALKALDIYYAMDNDIGIMKVRNLIGIIYFYYGDYASALENFLISLDLSKDIDDINMYTSAVNNIGEVYREAKEYDKALTYYEDALEKALKHIDDPELELNSASIYLNIGEILYLKRDYEASLMHVRISYELAHKHKNIILMGEAQTKLGRAMIQAEEYDLANQYYQKAKVLYQEVNNRFYKIELLINQADLFDILGKDSIHFLQEALNDAVALNLDSKISLVYKRLSEYHEKTDDYKEALKYYKYFSMKEKEIEASNLSQKLALLSLELEHSKEKKDQRRIREVTRKLRKDILYINKELEETKNKNIKLMNDSMVDELTGTFNRRGIHYHYNEFLSTKNNKMSAITIYMIDIDYFKAYNDSLGHLEGDISLKKVANVLNNIPCEDYFVGRFGGEEFVVVARTDNSEKAIELAEYMRQQVESMDLRYILNEQVKHLTISIGAYIAEDYTGELLQIIDHADQALYEAKEYGRNRVCFV